MNSTEKLRKIWEEKKDKVSGSDSAIELLESIINGEQSLCDETLLQVADFLEVSPTDIDPDFKLPENLSLSANKIRGLYASKILKSIKK